MFVKNFRSSIKIRRKYVYLTLITVMAIFTMFSTDIRAMDIRDGYYKIHVSLIKKYENQLSMGNNALYPEGILEVKNGKTRLKVRFNSLKFMNFTGYLSNLQVKDRKVEVLTKYDKYDVYNNPINGADPNYKGKKYPKDMIFDISANESEIPVKVYVPVMQELGAGEQEARLKVDWNKGYSKIDSDKFESLSSNAEKVESVKTIDLPVKEVQPTKNATLLPELEKGEKLELENGIYTVNVEIYNERENKPSMGNKAMNHVAEIVADNGKYKMLIGSDKMTVQNITASLVSLQIRDDNGNYFFAEPHAFDLKIDGDPDKRPKVFDFNVSRKDPFTYIKVDPKVKPMGEVPIGARLKIDWASLKKIDDTEAELLKEMKNGTKRPKFNPESELKKEIDGITIIAPPRTFDENIRFKYEIIFGGPEYIDVMNKLGRGSEFKVYSFKAENDYGMPKVNKNKITIRIPKKDLFEGSVYAKNISNMQSIPVVYNGDFIELKLDKLGKVVIVSDNKKAENNKEKPKESRQNGISRNNTQSKVSNISKNKYLNTGRKSAATKTKEINKTEETKSNPVVLKNEDENFNESLVEKNKDKIEVPVEKDEVSPKESPKIIFFSTAVLLFVAGACIYIYREIGKKLIYELKLNERLKKELEKYNEKR